MNSNCTGRRTDCPGAGSLRGSRIIALEDVPLEVDLFVENFHGTNSRVNPKTRKNTKNIDNRRNVRLEIRSPDIEGKNNGVTV